VPVVKFCLFTLRSVRMPARAFMRTKERKNNGVNKGQILACYERDRDRKIERECAKGSFDRARNVPHLLQVNSIFVVRRLEFIGIPFISSSSFPSSSSPPTILVDDDDDSASIRSAGCSDAKDESLLLLANGDSETTFQDVFFSPSASSPFVDDDDDEVTHHVLR
jgi:hypothetical protein